MPPPQRNYCRYAQDSSYTMMCVSTMSQMAGSKLERRQEKRHRDGGRYNRRRQVIVKGLRGIGLSCFEPKGAFYAFPSIKSTGMTSEEFAEKLLSEEKVAVVPGSASGNAAKVISAAAMPLRCRILKKP